MVATEALWEPGFLESLEEVYVPSPQLTAATFLKNVSVLGVTNDFLLKRLFPVDVMETRQRPARPFFSG
jgi:hypothetical protein